MQNDNVEYLCSMKFQLKVFFSLSILVLFTACTIEKARPTKKQQLIIASDCLTQKDKILFKNFEKAAKITIHIRSISTDSLYKLLKTEGLVTEIDCIITSSVYQMERFSKAHFLHTYAVKTAEQFLPKKFISQKQDYLGFGYDPYVFLTNNDTLSNWKNYLDLTKKQAFTTDLIESSDLLPFYAIVFKKLENKKPRAIYDWKIQFYKNKINSKNDSLNMIGTTLFFTRYSHYESRRNSFKHLKKYQLVFPNQRKAGSYYTMPCFGIVKQARNYSNAQLFLSYFLKENVNKRVTSRLNLFPVIVDNQSSYPFQNQRFKKNTLSPIQQTALYPRIKAIMKLN